jgi:glycosyltransferase involved in cell wall biosynthesis
MNVVHVVHGYAPAVGGTEFLFQQISERLVSQFGDRVTILTTNAYSSGMFVDPTEPSIPMSENEEINGVRVLRFPVNNRIAPRIRSLQQKAFEGNWPFNDVIRTLYHGPISWPMFKAILNLRADVVAASAFPLLHMYYAALGKRFNRIPLVLYGALHPGQRWSYDRAIIYRAIAACDIYVAYTPFERDFVVGKGISSERVRVVSPGVDVDLFESADGTAVRRELGWQDVPVVGFVGQQSAHKGIDTLYRAMRFVWRQLPEARLLVAGGRTAYSPYLDRILDGFSPQERSRLHIVPDFSEQEKPQLFAACDVFVSPSGHESFGLTFIEAWAAGKPVIGCRSGAISSVIDEWEDGLLVPYRDAAQLACAILEVLTDDVLRQQMGSRGKDKVVAHHTWDIAIDSFRQAYEDAMQERSCAS